MECWKPIKDSNGHYFISDQGNCYREAYSFISTNGRHIVREYKKYTPHLNKGNGYYYYSYPSANRGSKTKAIHRLVAEHFITNPKPEEYDQINHIDGDKSNNVYTNLEWVNTKLNMEHASKHGLINTESEKRKKQAPLNGLKSLDVIKIPVAEYDESGNFVKIIEFTNHAGNSCCRRLSYHGRYYRQVKILKQIIGEVPSKIDVERIKAINNKGTKLYRATNDDTVKEYLVIKDLPIQRDELWFCFNHQVPDRYGNTWEILNRKNGRSEEEIKKAVGLLKTHTYNETAELTGIPKASLIKYHKMYPQ